MNYLLIFILVVIVCALIFETKPPASKTPIKLCRACGAEGQLTGDFFDFHVQCSNRNCAMAGPKGQDEQSAISFWNSISDMSAVVSWQFKASGLALENQRLRGGK